MIVCSVVWTSSFDADDSRDLSVASKVCAGCVSVMTAAMLKVVVVRERCRDGTFDETRR